MKRTLAAFLSALVLTAAAISAQSPIATTTASTDPTDTVKENTYYGCLVPGSNSDSFRLINVALKGQKRNDQVSYKVDAPEKLDVMHFVTMEVEIVGTVVGTGSSAVLKATKISRKSDYCG